MTPASDSDGQDKFANTSSTTSTTTTTDCCSESTPSMVTERVGLERGDSIVESVTLGADSCSWSRQPTKRSSSLVNAAAASDTRPLDDRSAHSENDSELDIYVTDLASFLSSNGDPATVAAYEEHRRNKLNKWSGRRQNLNESPSPPPKSNHEDDYAERRRDAICDCDCDLEDPCGGFVTPPMSSYDPQPWTPDVYESVTRSLKEFRKTYQMQSEACSLDGEEPTGGSSSSSGSRIGNCGGSDGRGSVSGHMKPFSKADQYVVSLPNMDIEDKAMHIDRLIVKSFRHLNNLTKVRFREMLDDDVISTVMERYKDQHRDILFVTPCITKCVMVLQDHVANFLDPIKAKNYDLIFFVISDASSAENGAAHWSLLLLHRPQKTFYHYDSMHGSHYNAAFELMYKVWSYFKIKKGFQPECEQQPNGVDCGFYVIHNMLRCIRIAKEELYDEEGARITLKEPLKLPLSVDETKSIVIKTYVSSIVDKIKKTTVDKF